MQRGKALVFCAWSALAGCGGATSEPGESEDTGGASGAGGSTGGGGAQASGGSASAGGKVSTGGLSGSGGAIGGSGGAIGGSGGAIGGSGGAIGGSGGTNASGGVNSGGSATGGTTPGCAPLPAEPVYSCMMRQYQEGDCLPWTPQNFAADRTLPSYPPGCVVTLPYTDGFSRCGPQRCTCESFPGPDGAITSDWLCPL